MKTRILLPAGLVAIAAAGLATLSRRAPDRSAPVASPATPLPVASAPAAGDLAGDGPVSRARPLAPSPDGGETSLVDRAATAVLRASSGGLVVSVHDVFGRPLPDAFGAWTRGPVARRWLPDPSEEKTYLVRADGEGRLRFPDPAEAERTVGDPRIGDPRIGEAWIGEITVGCAGYVTQRRVLEGVGDSEPEFVLLPVDRTRVRTLRLLDAAGRALAGVPVAVGRRLLTISDSGGWIQLDPDAVRGASLFFAGPVFPCTLTEERLAALADGDALVLPLSAAGRLRFPSSADERAATFEILGEAEGFDVEVAHDGRLRIGPDGEVPFTAPAGLPVDVAVYLSDGRSVEVSLDVRSDGWVQDLAFDDGPVLAIRVERDGRPCPGATAAVTGGRLEEPRLTWTLRGDDRGILRIPSPDRVRRIELTAPGGAPIHLRPHGEGPRDGVLNLEVPLAHTLIVHARTRGGDPVTGIAVTADPQATDVFRHPELHGGRPTNHPAWSIERERRALAWVDGAGDAGLSLAGGAYRVRATHLPWRKAPVRRLAGLEHDVVVPETSEVELVVPSPRRCILEVRDATTGLPVEHTLLRVGENGPLFELERARWEGWLDDRAQPLVVLGPGGSHGRLDLPPGNAPVHEQVLLSAGDALPVRLVGPDGKPAAGPLRCEVFEVLGDGTELLRGAFDLALDRDGVGALFVPFEPGAVVRLSLPGAPARGLRPDRLLWGAVRDTVVVRLDR